MNEILAWIVGVIALVLPGFGQPAAPVWTGYAEADYVYVSAAAPGVIATIDAAEGQQIDKGALLFTLDAEQQQALRDAAAARVDAAQANLDNLLTGSRSEEVDVIRASLEKARADLNLAQQGLVRSEKLFAQGLIPEARLDQDRAAYAAAQAAAAQLEAQLKVAELPARYAQQIAAEANLAAARADALRTEADLAERRVVAPVAGRIEQVFFDQGEMAGAGVPVVSISGAGLMTIKFFVSEAERPNFALGQTVTVGCDGCAAGLTATIAHFAGDPQFTPPVIYSRDERSRLVFLVEARLDQENGVLPGQPVTIGVRP